MAVFTLLLEEGISLFSRTPSHLFTFTLLSFPHCGGFSRPVNVTLKIVEFVNSATFKSKGNSLLLGDLVFMLLLSFVDIDECLVDNGLCSQNCSNLEGSYRCVCRMGYYLYTGREGVVSEAVVNRTCLGMQNLHGSCI